MRRLYAEVGQAEIARRYQVSRPVVRRWLLGYNLELRPMAVVQRERLHRLPKAALLDLTAKSRAVIQAQHYPHEWLVARALTKQRTIGMTRYEGRVYDALIAWGHLPVPQFAVDKFNIDLALVSERIAVEVDGGFWHNGHSPRKLAQDQAKETFLASQGWSVIRVSARDDRVLDRSLRRLRRILSA